MKSGVANAVLPDKKPAGSTMPQRPVGPTFRKLLYESARSILSLPLHCFFLSFLFQVLTRRKVRPRLKAISQKGRVNKKKKKKANRSTVLGSCVLQKGVLSLKFNFIYCCIFVSLFKSTVCDITSMPNVTFLSFFFFFFLS